NYVIFDRFVMRPKMTIKSFHTILSKQTNGRLIKLLDILRVVFFIIILIGSFYEILANSTKHSTIIFYMKMIVFNFSVCIFIFVAYGIRQSSMNNEFVISDTSSSKKEYYWIYNAYYRNILLECFLAFALLIKLLLDYSNVRAVRM